MAELFQVDKSGISRHLKNIYDTSELTKQATVAKYATVQKEGNLQVQRALEKARSEYEKYIAKHLNDPTLVEKHFLKVVKEVKQIEKSAKGRKKP